ncbi:hypothetical protein [Neomegalonema sp.]|uniref:hypothetical protein n=1 Tax=Neomegalonema sp. TaxID=2039713 RepID=UPI002633A4A0|nr:hypothetical protein [Neomegalonema sp.]MDD2868258.1 hypothetical protein [Neomegalonema sp.]
MALIESSETALYEALARINAARRSGVRAHEEALVSALFETEQRLAVYVARAPARFDNHILGRFAGQWGVAILRGRLAPATPWGSPFGFPAVVWDPAGDPVTVSVLRAPGITAQWSLLDSFAEIGFLRTLAPCELASGEIVVANLYEPRKPA